MRAGATSDTKLPCGRERNETEQASTRQGVNRKKTMAKATFFLEWNGEEARSSFVDENARSWIGESPFAVISDRSCNTPQIQLIG